MPSERPVSAPISPAQAAQIVHTSRRTIMRAIESLELKAIRDNRNRWKIDQEDLERWAKDQGAPSERAHTEAPTLPSSDMALTLARAEAERDALREQLDQIKEDRNHWRSLAERQQRQLEQHRPGWRWPWSK